MTGKFLAAALAVFLVPAAAVAQPSAGDPGARYDLPRSAADYGRGAVNGVATFLTRVIVPQDSGRPSVAYADNPDLIGNRHGATDPAWRK